MSSTGQPPTPTPTPATTGKRSSRSKKSKSKRTRKGAPKTKVVVRRLPPNLPESVFQESVKTWMTGETTDWYCFYPGNISKSKAKESVFSRAYIHFKSIEQVLEFHRGYDGHMFVDSKGTESRAVVEFAPFQKIPKEHKKIDPRQDTINSDPDYTAFLESLKEEENPTKEPGDGAESGASQLEKLEARLASASAAAQAAAESKPKSTPLLDHIRAQKAALKAKAQQAKGSRPIAILSSPKSAKVVAQQAQHLRAKAADAAASARLNANSKPSRKERERRKKDKKDKAAAASGSSSGTTGANSVKPADDTNQLDANGNNNGKESRKSSMNPIALQQLQQRQKDQIRQIIHRPVAAAGGGSSQESTVAVASPPPTPGTPTTPTTPKEASGGGGGRNRNRSRRQSADVKASSFPQSQVQILSKPSAQTPSVAEAQSFNSASNSSSPTTNVSGSTGSPASPTSHRYPRGRGSGRGYFGKGGRW